jgi:hypothetical protein
MKKLVPVILIALMLSGCARSCQSLDRNVFDNLSHELKITVYSGGDTIYHSHLKKAIINSSESSDGYFFYNNEGKLIEVSGDIVIEYLD